MSQSLQLSDGLPTVALFPTLRVVFHIVWQASPGLLLGLVVLTALNGMIAPLMLQVRERSRRMIVKPIKPNQVL